MLPATATSLEPPPAPPRAPRGTRTGPRRKASRRAERTKMRQTSTPTTEERQRNLEGESRDVLSV